MEHTIAFLDVVKPLLTMKEFYDNFVKIGQLKPTYRDGFIVCLKMGCDLSKAFEAAELLFDITVKSALTTKDVIRVTPDIVTFSELMKYSKD